AEGHKQAAILKSEGDAAAIKKVADAEKYRKTTVADGEAQAVEKVYSAIHRGKPTPDLVAIKYLESLIAIANGQATKVFIPYESAQTLGSIGAIKELFADKQG
ncbi:SPFH/Band 7/PHB domain protein, partial [bacterium]